MKTQVVRVDARKPSRAVLKDAARRIRQGMLVAFPTETVYGLGANAFDAKAVRAVFRVKKRPADDPLIVHVSSARMLRKVVAHVPVFAERLMKEFWPGPLTLVLPKSDKVPDVVTSGLPFVAVRMPSHPVARGLIAAAGVPVAAPSANVFGRPSPTRAEHVVHDLKGRIPLVLDAGQSRIGVESTVLSLAGKPVVLRPGGVPVERLREHVPGLRLRTVMRRPTGPGMKYRHYAPKALLVLVRRPSAHRMEAVLADYNDHKVGVLCMHTIQQHDGEVVFLGRTAEEVARNLFAGIRHLDRKGVDVIIAEGVSEKGMGLALMNRLRRAAGRVV